MSQVYQGRRRDSLRRRAALAATLALTPAGVVAYLPKWGVSLVAKNRLHLSNQNLDNGDFPFNSNNPFDSPRDPNVFAGSSSSSTNSFRTPSPRPGSSESLGGYQFSSTTGIGGDDYSDSESADAKAENDAYYAEKLARQAAAEEEKRAQASIGLQEKTAALLREAEAKRLANKQQQNPTQEVADEFLDRSKETNQAVDYQWQMKAAGDRTEFFGQNNDEKMRRAELEAKARSEAAAAARAKAEELRREWEAEQGQTYESPPSFARASPNTNRYVDPLQGSPSSNSGLNRQESRDDAPFEKNPLSSDSSRGRDYQVQQTKASSSFPQTRGNTPLPSNPISSNTIGGTTDNIRSQQPSEEKNFDSKGQQTSPFAPFQRSAEATNLPPGNPFSTNPFGSGDNKFESQQISTYNAVDSKDPQPSPLAPFQRDADVTNPPPGNPLSTNPFGSSNNKFGSQQPSAAISRDSNAQQTSPFAPFQRDADVTNPPPGNPFSTNPFGSSDNSFGSRKPSSENSFDSKVQQPSPFAPFQRDADATSPPLGNPFSTNPFGNSDNSFGSRKPSTENSFDSKTQQTSPFAPFQRDAEVSNAPPGNPLSTNPFGSSNNKFGSQQPSAANSVDSKVQQPSSFAPFQRDADATSPTLGNPFSTNPFGSTDNSFGSKKQPSTENFFDSKTQQTSPFAPFQRDAEVANAPPGNPLSTNPFGSSDNKFGSPQPSAANSADSKVQQPSSFAPFQRDADVSSPPPGIPLGTNPFGNSNNSFGSKQPATANSVDSTVQQPSHEANLRESQSVEPQTTSKPRTESVQAPLTPSSSLPVAFTPLDALAVNREAEEEKTRIEEQRRRLEAKTQFLQGKDGKDGEQGDVGLLSDEFKAQQQAAMRVEEAERLQADRRRAEEARRQEEQANRIRAEQALERKITAERNQSTSENERRGKGNRAADELGKLDAENLERLRGEAELRRKAEEQARIARLEVARRQAAEEAEREKAIADEKRRKADEARQAAIAAARRKSEEEQAAKRAAEEARKQEELKRVQEAKQRADELRYKAEAETNRQEIRNFVESKRREVDTRRMENEDRKQLDDEVRFRAEEARRWAEEEARRKTGRPLGGLGNEEDEEASRIRNVYMKWCDFYGKRFDESRLDTFAKNLIEIERHFSNSGGPVQLNEFADLTAEQYRMREENPILWDEIERRRWDEQVPLQMEEPSIWQSGPFREEESDVIDVGPPREVIDAYDPVLQVDPWRREEEEWNRGRGLNQPSESEIIDKAKRRGEFEAKRKAELDARRKAEQEKEDAEKLRLLEEARVRGEAAARLKAEEEARRAADEDAKRKAVEEAQRRGTEEAKRKAEAELKRAQEERELEEARKAALEEAKRRGEAALRRKAEEERRATEIQREAEMLQGRQPQNQHPRTKANEQEDERNFQANQDTLKPNDPDVGIWRNTGTGNQTANRMNLDDESRRKLDQRMGSSTGLPSYQMRGPSTPPMSTSQESPMDAWNAAIKRGQEVAKQRAKLEEQKLAELAKLEEEKKSFFETVKSRAQDEALKRAEAVEKKRKEEEEAKKRLVEEAVKRAEEEQRKRAEAQARRRQEIEKLVEIEQKRKEEVKRIATEAALRRETEAKRLREEQAKKVEEERQRKAEANLRATEEAKRKAEEIARRREERVRLALEEQQKKETQRKEAAEIARRKAQEIEIRKAEQLQQIQEEKNKKDELRRKVATQLRADQEAREVARLGARRQAAFDMSKKLSEETGVEERSKKQDIPPQGNEFTLRAKKLEPEATIGANTTEGDQRSPSESSKITSQQSSYTAFPSAFGSYLASVESSPNETSRPENKRNYNPFQKSDTGKSKAATSPVGSYLGDIANVPASSSNIGSEEMLTLPSDATPSMKLAQSNDSRKNLESDDDNSASLSNPAASPKRSWSPFKAAKQQATPSSQSPFASYLSSVGNVSDNIQPGTDAPAVFESTQENSPGVQNNLPSDTKRNYNPFQKAKPVSAQQQPFGSYLESPAIAARNGNDTTDQFQPPPNSVFGPPVVRNTPYPTSADPKTTEPDDMGDTKQSGRASFPNSQPISPFTSTEESRTTLSSWNMAGASSRFDEESERRIQGAGEAARKKAEELRKEFEMKQLVGEAMPLKGEDDLIATRIKADSTKREAEEKREAADKAIKQAQKLRAEANKLQEANESVSQSSGKPSYMDKVAKSFVAGSTRLEQLNKDISRLGDEFTVSEPSTDSDSSEQEKRANEGEEGMGGVPNLFSMFFGRSSRKTQESRERINNTEKEQGFSRWEDNLDNGVANQDGATTNDEGLPFFLSQRSSNGGSKRPPSEVIDKNAIPTISSWGQTPEGSIHGFISRSPNFEDGAYIITTPVEKGAKGGSIVTTASGSQYRLSEERNSFETVRVDSPSNEAE